MSLYIKYRPKTFEEMEGNDEQIESLKSILSKKEKPHTFLFSGDSGCGKTTAARICASMLGADELSIHEVNTANNRGIDTAREIIQNLNYGSVSSECVVYIIDEVHKTTNEWQNAMLKPLEDVPEHVYFFLCTTNPNKLIKTIRTRATQYKFDSLNYRQIYRLLKRVCTAEEVNIDKEVLKDIASACQGSARSALVILEKIIGIEDPESIEKIIKQETIDKDEEVIEICRNLIKGTWPNICDHLKNLKTNDYEKVRWAVMGYMKSILLSGNRNDKAAIILEIFEEPFYDSGLNGLVSACYQSFYAKN